MGFLDYKVRPRILVVGTGHTYNRTGLMDMFESFEGTEAFLVEHPLAERVLNPQSLSDVDAVVLYNMFSRWIAGYRVLYAEASNEVERLVSRDLDRATQGSHALHVRSMAAE